MKVWTESMSSSAFVRGCADARVVNLSILDFVYLLLLLVFHAKLAKLELDDTITGFEAV